MRNELYQLVALDKNNIEYIIELRNDNKKNKGTLEFIDSGTTRFRDQQHLAAYLYKNGKIPTTDVVFSIKYLHNGDRYIPLIFNNLELYNVLSSKDETTYNDFAYIVLRKLEAELSNRYFYKYLLTENLKNMKMNHNGNYFDLKLAKNINDYYNEFIAAKDIDSNRSDIQLKILKELYNYKQLRTIYMFYNEFIKQKQQIIDTQLFQKYDLQSSTSENYDQTSNMPDHVNETYKKAISDGEDIFDKGIKFR